jgi:P-type conjugative transfer protein TrbJ
MLTAARELDQVNNQLKMLAGLQFDSVGEVRAAVERVNALLAQAEGIGYRIERLGALFDQRYPGAYRNPSFAALANQIDSWIAENRSTLRQAMEAQNTVANNLPATEARVAGAVAASQAAPGQTAAIQATNQLLATVSGQLAEISTLLIAQSRALDTLNAQQNAEKARDDAWHNLFVGGGGSSADASLGVAVGAAPYTPHPTDPFALSAGDAPAP